jgi:hypothetical protein
MVNNANLNSYQRESLHLSSYLKSLSVLLMISLVFICVLGCYCLSSIGVFVKASAYFFVGPEQERGHFSYYSSNSIFSNLSRGLPIDAGLPSTETLNGQEENEGKNFNPTDREPNQEQEQQP